ncbi:NADH-ubiquinone oxidoreductase chain J [Roseibacterium elongatum DSM 19469]|uniref:NADH-quinone oxidoreductase subunit J n=1 Tax=Roseicyclus elongatus DSM 19469 TaxID=1294273 RepID=W8S197_9RHOB|nr:NADH-quinone oxidoreductase subunit J [Roseibacterium elongatum]AHM02481.1 NADH-ubiquinone oxidoreductase chain J [Roseibacterium elongatum DSM 19469]
MSWGVAIWAATVAFGAAILAVTRPSAVHALLLLLAALISLGVGFFAMGANFAGAIQLLIYAGAVVAVFVFVVMTVDAGDKAMAVEREMLRHAWRWPAFIVSLSVVPILFGIGGGQMGDGAPAPVRTEDLGLLLFGEWSAVTELITLLLIAGMLGVRHLGRALGPRLREREPE